MLPLNYEGWVTFPGISDDPAVAVERLAVALTGLRARAVQRESAAVEFTAGPFRLVSSRNLLGPISRGRVELVRSGSGWDAHYRLTFTELVATASLMIVVLVATFIYTAWPAVGFAWPVVAAGGWAWLVGGNIAITLVRFPDFLVRAAAGAGSGGAAGRDA